MRGREAFWGVQAIGGGEGRYALGLFSWGWEGWLQELVVGRGGLGLASVRSPWWRERGLCFLVFLDGG